MVKIQLRQVHWREIGRSIAAYFRESWLVVLGVIVGAVVSVLSIIFGTSFVGLPPKAQYAIGTTALIIAPFWAFHRLRMRLEGQIADANAKREEMRNVARRISDTFERLIGDKRDLQERLAASLEERKELLRAHNKALFRTEVVFPTAVAPEERLRTQVRYARTELEGLILAGETIPSTILGGDHAYLSWLNTMSNFANARFSEEFLREYERVAGVLRRDSPRERVEKVTRAARWAHEHLAENGLLA